MSTAMQIIMFFVAVVLVAAVILLAASIISALGQFKSLLIDMEKTSGEIRGLARQMQTTTARIELDAEKIGDLLDAYTETVTAVSSSVRLINRGMLTKATGLLAFIPALKFGWNLVKKFQRR